MRCSVAGLDNFKAKKEKKKERKRRAKLRKAEQKERESSSGMVLTAAMRAKSAPVLPEVMEYKDPKKRKRKQKPEVIIAFTDFMLNMTIMFSFAQEQEGSPPPPDKKMKKSSSLPETTMKAARFDVFKFGMRGMDRASREEAEVARLVSLGARKPKNKGYGYKELKVGDGVAGRWDKVNVKGQRLGKFMSSLQEMRSKEREEEKNKKEEERISGVRIAMLRKSTSGAGNSKSSQSSSTKKKPRSGSAGILSKVGSFDGGMLKLSSKDLAKIKGQKKQK